LTKDAKQQQQQRSARAYYATLYQPAVASWISMYTTSNGNLRWKQNIKQKNNHQQQWQVLRRELLKNALEKVSDTF
jgi:hypothetical protein